MAAGPATVSDRYPECGHNKAPSSRRSKGNTSAVDPVLARTASTLGDAFFLLAAPVALAGCLALTCRAAHLTGSMPRWAAHTGYAVAAGLLLAGWSWFPLPLAAAWALIAGARLLIRPQPAHSTESDTSIDTTLTSPA